MVRRLIRRTSTSHSDGRAYAEQEAEIDDEELFKDESTSQVVFHYTFQTLHDYFDQKNAIRNDNKVTGNKWITTPPLDLEIDGVTRSVVACVRDTKEGKQENAGIYFFVGRPEGFLLGKLDNPLTELNVDGSWKIEAVGNGTESDFDFSNVSATELNKFVDNLYIILEGVNPRQLKKENEARFVEEQISSTEATTRRTRDNNGAFGASAKRLLRIIAPALGAPIGALLGLGITHLAQGVVNTSNDETTVSQDFYDVDHPLYGDATVDVDSETWSDVGVADADKIAELAPADEIRGLEELNLNADNSFANSFENDVEDPAKVVGNVYRVPIPEQGKCFTIKTFNIPNGTVQMVKSANAPALLVNLVKQENVEIGKAQGFTPKYTEDDSASDKFIANLSAATVCNTHDPDNVQLEEPQGDLFLKFTNDIASDAPFLQGP